MPEACIVDGVRTPIVAKYVLPLADVDGRL
jgi:hypothetical protein